MRLGKYNWVFLLLLGFAAKAQDPQFTQFFAAPVYHNPAFTGANLNARVGVNYRSQWPGLDAAFKTTLVSFDSHISKTQSGIGFLLVADQAGSERFRSTGFHSSYSYRAKLNSKIRLSSGISAGYVVRNINFNNATFGDQLSQEDLDGPSIDPLALANQSSGFLDLSGGLLLYSRKVWLSTAFHHFNRPNVAFGAQTDRLPIRFSVTGGIQIPIDNSKFMKINDKPRTIIPAFLFKQQGPFRQIDMGCYLNYNPVLFGLWYRGLPLLHSVQGAFTHDALALMTGIKQDNLTLGYSYDVNLSSIVPVLSGSHEISIVYEFKPSSLKKTGQPKTKGLPCPSF